jgi:hypothetical protein
MDILTSGSRTFTDNFRQAGVHNKGRKLSGLAGIGVIIPEDRLDADRWADWCKRQVIPSATGQKSSQNPYAAHRQNPLEGTARGNGPEPFRKSGATGNGKRYHHLPHTKPDSSPNMATALIGPYCKEPES